MAKTPEIIKAAMAARTAAGLKITFHHPPLLDYAAYDLTAYAKDAAQLKGWQAMAARRGVAVTIG